MAVKPPDGKKISKEAANYRFSALRRQCQDCSMFVEPSSCTLVEGYIARRGTCRFWERRKEAK